MRVEPLRLIGTPAPDDEWALLLQKRRAEEEEAEWRAQLARVEAELEEEREWTSRMSSVRVEKALEEDEEAEWSKIMSRVRTSTPAIMPVKTPLPQKAQSQVPTVRQRPHGKPAARVSHPPRVMESAAPLKFSLPGEGSDAKSTIREEITHVKARTEVEREHRQSVPTKRELPPVQKRDTSEVKPKREPSAPKARDTVLPAPRREALPVQKRESSRPSMPAPRNSTPPSGRVRAYPNTPHVNAPPKQVERPAQRLTLSPAQRATMPPVEPRPAPVVEAQPAQAPSQARKSSPGMNSLRVAANKKTASDSGVRNVVQKQAAKAPVARKSAPAPQKPVEEKKDSSLVGLSAAIELIEREHASARPSNVAPPPPPRGSLTPQASVVQTGAPTSHAATSPVRPSTPSGLPALHIPTPPMSRTKQAKLPKARITVPPPPPPSRSKKDAAKGVVSRVRSVLSALTKSRG